MRLSLGIGVLMLAGKTSAWLITGSAAILSDAMESVIHVVAVAFAAFSLWLSQQPANDRYPYGYDRITFFSAGFEGGMIVLAALGIIGAAVDKWLRGLTLEHLGAGTLLVAAAGLINGMLGGYLVWVGKRKHSIILVANGKHVLTDCWTSLGVIAGLSLVMWTGWKPFDPLCAIALALNILWSGGTLVYQSALGLLDKADPETGATLRRLLGDICTRGGIEYHALRYRQTGERLLVDVHLLFPSSTPVGRAHAAATEVEEAIATAFELRAEVFTHLEAIEDHGLVHTHEHPPA